MLFTAVEESGGHGSEHDGDLNMGISFGLGCLHEVIEIEWRRIMDHWAKTGRGKTAT